MENQLSKHEAQSFLNSLSIQQFLDTFDLMDNLLFWVKDSSGRFIHINKYVLKAFGNLHLKNQKEVIGLTDFDFFPKPMALEFLEDDRQTMQGAPIVDRLEMNILTSGEMTWVSTSKYPLFDTKGNVVGTYGISQPVGHSFMARKALEELQAPIEFIRNNYMEQICIADLAVKLNISVSSLERRFAKHMNRTPKQFLNEIRLEKARQLLKKSPLPVSTVAYQTGFSDPGYFTRQYHKRFGITPSQEISNSEQVNPDAESDLHSH